METLCDSKIWNPEPGSSGTARKAEIKREQKLSNESTTLSTLGIFLRTGKTIK